LRGRRERSGDAGASATRARARGRATRGGWPERRLTKPGERDAQLAEIQSRLLDIGSAVATPLCGSSEAMKTRASFSAAHVVTLEGWIDAMDAELPALTNFLLVSGGKASVFLHQARVVCRRAERRCVSLVRDGAVPDVVRVYLNRLSDYMFTAARFAAMKAGRAEEAYRKSTAD
jgi:ATP:cob(I)alamin adenosyltransferase